MASIWRSKDFQFCADDGTPLNAGTIDFYVTGTTTRKNAYSNEALSTPIANTYTLAADGRPDDNIWISGRYRIIVKTSGGTTIADIDPVEDTMPASDFQDGSPSYGGTAGGTANALTFAFTPTLTALNNGATYRGRVGASANTSTVTINQDGLGAKSLTWPNGDTLDPGELPAGAHIEWNYNSTADRFELQTVTRPPLVQGPHTIQINASAMLSRTTNGAAAGLTELATNDVMLSTKDFDQTTSEGVQFYLTLPKSTAETTLTFQAGWTAASGSGTVTWGFRALAVGDDDAMDAAFGTAQTVTDTLITANDMHVTSVSSAVTPSGTWAEGDTIIVEVYRDISDTLNADAKLIWVKAFPTLNAGNDA